MKRPSFQAGTTAAPFVDPMALTALRFLLAGALVGLGFAVKVTIALVGLGLALASNVMDQCGGEIRVDSEVGHGTTMHLLLPRGSAADYQGGSIQAVDLKTGAVQLLGAMLGAWLAHAMFGEAIWQFSAKLRSGPGQWLAEAVASAGLLLVILRAAPGRAGALVACWIGAAYWFTASTSFANPAAAFGRMFSDSFAGIAPASVPGFVAAELVGAALGLALHRLLGPAEPTAPQA